MYFNHVLHMSTKFQHSKERWMIGMGPNWLTNHIKFVSTIQIHTYTYLHK